MSGSIGSIGQTNPFANFPNRPKLTWQFYHFQDDRDCLSSVWSQGGTGSQTDFSTVSDEVGGAVSAATKTSTPAQGDYHTTQHVSEQFKLSIGAEIFFMARAKFDEATNCQIFLGIAKQVAAIDTAGVLGGSGGTAGLSTDVIGAFWKDDGDTNIDMIYGKNVATSNANYTHAKNAVGTLVASTYKDYAFRIKMDDTTAQKGVYEAWLDGVKVMELSFTDLCEDEEGALTFGVAVGATTGSAVRTITVDYIGAYQRAA